MVTQHIFTCFRDVSWSFDNIVGKFSTLRQGQIFFVRDAISGQPKDFLEVYVL